EDVFALNHLVQRPHAGLHRHLGDLHQLLAGIPPAAGAGRHHVQERRAGGVDGLVGLLRDVLEVSDERGLGHIGDAVGHHDLRQVLLLLHLAGDHRALRRGGGVGKVGGGGGTLDAGVHVRLVVVADIHHVVAALHGAGQALEADVVGAAVAAEGDELVRIIQLAPLLHRPVCRLHAGDRGRRIFKGVVDEAVLPRRVGVHEGGDLQAAGGGAHHRLVLRV
ncbi:TVP38/TMEM64 family membrane protein, partial [Dysosmobacter welbionis]